VGRSFGGVVAWATNSGNILRQPDINLPTSQRFRPMRRFPRLWQPTQLRPYQGYTSIRMYLSDSTANYNACSLRDEAEG